jgi:iron(III) transport system substrate-binding protein
MWQIFHETMRAAFVAALICAATAASAVEPTPVTLELVAAAVKEGNVVWYASEDAQLVAAVSKAFEAKYPGITAQGERNGAERNFQRVSQEYDSNIHVVDVITSSNPGPILYWKRNNLLAPFVPAETADWPQTTRDLDGYYTVDCLTLAVMGVNTKLVKPEDAPKTWTDLLDPKWKGKLVKAHPGYSGTIVTSTLALSKLLGWQYFEKLGQQQVMQVQSAIDPPRKLAFGERSVMIDGAEASALQQQEQGAPIALIYRAEGTPAVPLNGVLMKLAPHPNAARLFYSFLFSNEAQQIFVKYGFRSVRSDVADPPGGKPIKDIKLLFTDPQEQENAAEEIKKRYAQYFGI